MYECVRARVFETERGRERESVWEREIERERERERGGWGGRERQAAFGGSLFPLR